MCGITGFLNFRSDLAADDLRSRVRAMADSLAHRGPDNSGIWVDAHAGVALGHRRLAILDLSPLGNQPMISASGRYVITLNGEIYNYRELRHQLKEKGHRFRGTSDTEVMLAAFEEWGVEACVPKLTGMFAFAVWDRERHTLTLARDRLGEKPLYYSRVGNTFAFASELKALRTYPSFDGEIDRDALAAYLRHNYIPAPHSIYRSILKLEPGHILEVAAAQISPPRAYWSLYQVAKVGIAEPFTGSTGEAVNELDELLGFTVQRQMVADVPLGAFLSGGIDSSLVVAIMQKHSARPIKTFTIGFEQKQFDEAPYARAVARFLKTDHTELYVSPEQAMEVIPHLPEIYDEPFSDSSQIPTYLVAKLAGEEVTVSLSGDGGDELFGGYDSYEVVSKLWKLMESPVRTIHTNVRATELVLEAAAKKKKKVVITSTSEVYGKSTKLPFAEDDDLVIGSSLCDRWSYACSKAIDEFLAIAYQRERDVPCVVVRLFNTVGPRQTGTYGMVLPRFVKQALMGMPITIFGDGTQSRCFGWVGDVSRALVRLSELDRAEGLVFNIGSDEEVTINELASVVLDITNSRSRIQHVSYEEAYGKNFEDMARRVPDLTRIRETIGYQVSKNLRDIVEAVASSMLDSRNSQPRVGDFVPGD